jgi:hypothetical protein
MYGSGADELFNAFAPPVHPNQLESSSGETELYRHLQSIRLAKYLRTTIRSS